MKILKLVTIVMFSACVMASNALPLESNVPNKQGAVGIESGGSTNVMVKPIDAIVAFVNKGVITSNQLDGQINIMRASYKDKGVSIPDTADFRDNVLNQLITLRVELDLAKRMGITTTDLEIANSIAGVAKTQGLTVEQFRAKVIADGINYDNFRQQVAQQITAEKLKQREVDARVVVTDEEIDRVLNSEAYRNRVDYNLSYIMINLPEQSSAAQLEAKRKLAMAAYAALQDGQSFVAVSAKYSNAPNALDGGNLGWKNSVVLPTAISTALAPLNKGEYTKIIQLPLGFLIFKVNDMRRLGSTQMVKQYHVRHILIKVGEHSSDSEAYQKIRMITADLDKYSGESENAEFVKLAKRYSEDASGINGGDIGWVSKGDTVPEFEAVMLSTPIGQISAPVRTPFGWHILQVEGVREADKTNEVVRASIRQEIRDIKATLLYTEWLRNIREAAYVKLNDN